MIKAIAFNLIMIISLFLFEIIMTKEPIHLSQENLDEGYVKLSSLELKLIQPYHLGGASTITPQLLEKAKETAQRNDFDFYMFVGSIKDEDFSRPGLLGNVHYYNKKPNGQTKETPSPYDLSAHPKRRGL